MLTGLCAKPLALLALMVLSIMPAVLCDEDGVPEVPEPPTKFSSAADVKNYLSALDHYYSVVSRPRFGKRANDYIVYGEVDGKKEMGYPEQFKPSAEGNVGGGKVEDPDWISSREVKDTRGLEHPSSSDPCIYHSNQRLYKKQRGGERNGGMDDVGDDDTSTIQNRRSVEHPGRDGTWMGRSMIEREQVSLSKEMDGREEKRDVEYPFTGRQSYTYATGSEKRYLQNLCASITSEGRKYPLVTEGFFKQYNNMEYDIAYQTRVFLKHICGWVEFIRVLNK